MSRILKFFGFDQITGSLATKIATGLAIGTVGLAIAWWAAPKKGHYYESDVRIKVYTENVYWDQYRRAPDDWVRREAGL